MNLSIKENKVWKKRKTFIWCFKSIVYLNEFKNGLNFEHSSTTCSTLIFFLSFAQISLISKTLSVLALSLLISKIECAPDHHSLIKSALFFQSFFFKFSFWVLNVGIEVCHLMHKIVVQFFLRVPSPGLLCIRAFWAVQNKSELNA